jgi:hypothetical protein
MTQQAREISQFGPWIDHFEQNATVHAHVDATIDFDGNCAVPEAVRRPLIASVRRFQLGESSDGLQLLRKAARAGDPEYLRAAELFVAEEQQHAALLLRLLGYLGGEPMRRHWSDAAFVRLRRLMGLRTELMVLTVAERIVADEHPHVRFQQQRLQAGFARSGIALRSLAFGLWWLTAIGATVVVALDHGPLLRAIGYRRVRFVRDVLGDFANVVADVLHRRDTRL